MFCHIFENTKSEVYWLSINGQLFNMADYWKSQPKKFCQYCKCWIADNKPSVEFHERGKNHKENVAAKIEEIKKKSIDKAKQEDRMSKEFAAIEEAALKAFQEDLKRLGAKSASAETPSPKPAVASSNSRSNTWLQGVSDDGHAYYYNTLTGESRWEKPEGYQEKRKKWRPKKAVNVKPSSCRWMEALSTDGYTYYYNTGTGESSWEKPEGYASPEKRGDDGETARRQEPPSLEHDPRTGKEETTDGAVAALEPESSREPRVPKISFRRRKKENSQPSNGGAGEDKDDDGEGDGEDEDENEQPTSRDQEGEEGKEEKKEEEKEKEKVKTPAKRPRRTNPYGEWEQIQEEEDPYESVDLQLPQVEAAPAPSELPPEPRVRFQERTITSLGDETGEGAFFRKRKAEGGKPRNLRQRGKDD